MNFNKWYLSLPWNDPEKWGKSFTYFMQDHKSACEAAYKAGYRDANGRQK